ncbi:hypothetical protein OIU78_020215 [Salix suchowensis]|nr:hypothetical protein OIU78_020215 [Salix suchowensis]
MCSTGGTMMIFMIMSTMRHWTIVCPDHGDFNGVEIDWSCFEKLVAELIEELELSILQKPLLKDDIAVQREDGDEVEGEIILWRPALKQINAWIPRKSKGTSIDLL